jgi:hypothetical protein
MEANQYLSWMINYDYGTDTSGGETVEWKGVAMYARVSPIENWRVSPRFEWFEDTDGYQGVAGAGTPSVLKTATITSQVLFNDSTSFWGEFRHDWTRIPGVGIPRGPAIFQVNDSGVRDYQSTLTFGVTYSFTRMQ